MVHGGKVGFAGAIKRGKGDTFLTPKKEEISNCKILLEGKERPSRNAHAAKAINSLDEELLRKCPVHFFKSILERRPKELQESGPHYLEVNKRPTTQFFFSSL